MFCCQNMALQEKINEKSNKRHGVSPNFRPFYTSLDTSDVDTVWTRGGQTSTPPGRNDIIEIRSENIFELENKERVGARDSNVRPNS